MILHKTIGDLCNGYKARIGYCEGELRRLEASPHRKHLQQEWDLIEGALAQYRRELEYWSKQDPKAPSCYGIQPTSWAYLDDVKWREEHEV